MQDRSSLAEATPEHLQGAPREGGAAPPVPDSLEDTGLTEEFLADLILKALYKQGALTGDDLTNQIKLPFAILDERLLDLQQRRYLEVRGTEGHGRRGYTFDLTTEGRGRVREILETSGYVGPAPVTMRDYWNWVDAHSVRDVTITREQVVDGFRHLVLDDEFIETIGPAINSGRSVFLYGSAGNGKTAIAEAIAQMFGGQMFIPHAIFTEGQVIQLYDPLFHDEIEDDDDVEKDWLRAPPDHDARFVKIKRPVVIVGGELTLDQLELQYDPNSKIFRAPPQVKANGGVFVIDDFGRQRVRPRDLLNRWMYPLERQLDFLTLPTGAKLAVPFDTLLIFATNLNPAELVEEAFLRRIRYKIMVENPTREQYEAIFERFCESQDIPYDADAVEYIYQEFYQRLGLAPRKCHPRDLLKQLLDLSRFQQREALLEKDMVRQACRTYFLDTPMGIGAGVDAGSEA